MFLIFVGHVLDMFRTFLGNVSDMFWMLFGYVLDMLWMCFGYVLDMFRTTFGGRKIPKLKVPRFNQNYFCRINRLWIKGLAWSICQHVFFWKFDFCICLWHLSYILPIFGLYIAYILPIYSLYIAYLPTYHCCMSLGTRATCILICLDAHTRGYPRRAMRDRTRPPRGP